MWNKQACNDIDLELNNLLKSWTTILLKLLFYNKAISLKGYYYSGRQRIMLTMTAIKEGRRGDGLVNTDLQCYDILYCLIPTAKFTDEITINTSGHPRMLWASF